ncbi:MAG: hypothetical protein WBF81_07770 [Thermoplasmata archaeon]
MNPERPREVRGAFGSSSTGSADPAAEEGAVSIARRDGAAGPLRRRFERPARRGIGAFLVTGSVTATAGISLWFSRSGLPGLGLAAFGAVRLARGMAQYLLLRREIAHWPDRALLWEEGVELVLHNGEVRGVSWTDPDLARTLVGRPAPPPVHREFRLVWIAEGRIPSVELSAGGFLRLRKAEESHRLSIVEHRRGREPRRSQWIEIRSRPPGGARSPRAAADRYSVRATGSS